jgi:hypothetical protein
MTCASDGMDNSGEFIYEDISSWSEPNDEDLKAFMEEHRETYLPDPQLVSEQWTLDGRTTRDGMERQTKTTHLNRKNPVRLMAAGLLLAALVAAAGTATRVQAQEDEQAAELAKKLANPISSLISVPIQANYDENIGLNEEGSLWRINVQPVIPFSIGEDWNVITRTIVPVIDQSDIPLKGEGEWGLGDITASQFFSPKAPTSRGWIWGAGPVWLIPTATDETLGAEKFGIGPTAVALKQSGPWTYGALANHLWSVAGEEDRPDVNATFIQPFLSYVTKTYTTLGINTEATYDWEGEAWSVPINLTVAQMLKVGGQLVQISGGARYWAESPDFGPDGWGARAGLTLVFPK